LLFKDKALGSGFRANACAVKDSTVLMEWERDCRE